MHLLSNDKDEEMKLNRNFIEYLASFTNYEGVKKVKEEREQKEDPRWQSDEQFDKSIEEQTYKTNKFVDAFIKMREADANTSKEEEEVVFAGIKLPTNLKNIRKK